MGGDLAVISTTEEQDRIKATFKQIDGDANWAKYWIGLKKEGSDITWVTGEKITLDSDLQFEDSSWQDKGESGCGSIRKWGINFLDGEQDLAGYVCEFPVKAATCGN